MGSASRCTGVKPKAHRPVTVQGAPRLIWSPAGSVTLNEVGQRLDDLQLLDDRARPSVRHDERQRIFVLRTNVNEVNVQAVDLGHELRESRSALPHPCGSRSRSPSNSRSACMVASCTPCDLVGDGLPCWPSRLRYAPAQVGEFRFRKVHPEGADRRVCCARLGCSDLCGVSHVSPFLRRAATRHR